MQILAFIGPMQILAFIGPMQILAFIGPMKITLFENWKRSFFFFLQWIFA
jgi:hypothetical protein